MNYTYLHYQTGLALLYGIGPKRARELINVLGSIEPLFKLTPSALAKQTGLNPQFFERSNPKEALDISDYVVEFHNKHGIHSMFYTDELFPRRLSQCSDAPLNLYSKGSIDLNSHRFVAVVGTRSATAYGKEICKALIESFKGRNIVVVSGLAFGIDSFAHRYCLEYGVPTIAILGHGLDRIYPGQNRMLAKRIIEEGGTLLTEFVPGTNPDRENFPKRNRIVAGMCDATIVVESKPQGGSLITANISNSYNKDVFAFPGDINKETSRGCNALIAEQKAHLVQDPVDFLTMMGWNEEIDDKPNQYSCFTQLNAIQKEITQTIRENPQSHIDVIANGLRMPISSLQVELLGLLLSGVIEELPGKRYVLT